MKICYITTDWATSDHRKETGEYGGVGYYRAYKPAEELRKIGYEVDVFGKDFAGQIKNAGVDDLMDAYKDFLGNYDMVILKQIDSPNAPRLIGACKELKIPIVMDIDDNIMEVSDDNPAAQQEYGEGGIKKAYAMSAMSICDAVFTSTLPLKEYYQGYMKKVFGVDMPMFVLPNCCVPSEWSIYLENKENIVIGWHGSVTHDEDLKLALPAIRDILKKRKDVKLELVGGIRPESQKELFAGWGDELKQVELLLGTPSWEGFPELIASRNWDIGIAPLTDNEFNRGKSHIKWMEYTLCGVPVVASRVYPYFMPIHGVETIVDRNTGMLASNRKEWKAKLLELIEDEDKRQEISENALKQMSKLTYKENIHLWDNAIKQIKLGE